MSVHIIYGTDQCDLPSHDDVHVDVAALEREPPHRPTYFPVTSDTEKNYCLFTTMRVSNPRVLPHDDAYTRVLCLQADTPTEPLMRRRNKITADFWTFGPLDRLYIACACLTDAFRTHMDITTAYPTYLAYDITFARDPCARGIPAADEWGLDRVLQST
ncbi:hypothetical protein K438DRAFT_1973953 [Mycena galopus ATCC 62051]|nr:hypothetical protein K438DRAFT_1973953 [Mycena galopus ATCC 62051]